MIIIIEQGVARILHNYLQHRVLVDLGGGFQPFLTEMALRYTAICYSTLNHD